MRRAGSAAAAGSATSKTAKEGPGRRPPFLFFVEGARDKGLLTTWAKKISRPLAKWINSETVILGGAQPARAMAQLQTKREVAPDAQGLCLLDRDCAEDDALPAITTEGMRVFVWPRRHIESYLLVPDAVCRAAKCHPDDPRVLGVFDRLVPDASDDAALRGFDAKALFEEPSPLSNALSSAVSAHRVARAMRAGELHPDVSQLLDRVAQGAGLRTEAVEVVTKVRASR